LDPESGDFSVALSRLTLPSPTVNPVVLSIGVGSDGGSAAADCVEKRTGLWKFP